MTTQALRPTNSQTDDAPNAPPASAAASSDLPAVAPLDIAPTDPLIAYLQANVSGVVDLDRLNLDSEGARALRRAGVRLALPLVSQGELVGLINLGNRRSEQDYSSDDRRLLGNLATQAAPAVRVAQLVRLQQLEALERQRIEQELRVAHLIQQTLLPKELPRIPGWAVDVYYQPARAVGGDFYDFIPHPDGRLGFVIGDVTDKGVPAALVMATTRSLLRAAAERFDSPGAVLERTNELLVEDIPPKMFVTCLYAVLEPRTGRLVYANAGHDVPYHRVGDGVVELRARGMPLGLLPSMKYEEKETTLRSGECLLLYSDGYVEAHSPRGEMMGFPRLQSLVGAPTNLNLIPYLLDHLRDFTGPHWEQEDDVTMVLLRADGRPPLAGNESWGEVLAHFELPSRPGNERRAMEQVAGVLAPLELPPATIERLKTAVAEAAMNAMEHGNQYQEDRPVVIDVARDAGNLMVSITDHGGGRDLPQAEAPDLDAKLMGLQSPRGWGLFLIQNMVDETRVVTDETRHTIELIVHLPEGASSGNPE
jgi:serine phosphatase RsbU (regulator of sigma subunit)/anti-sigma regulatory factor (Ser/Thr protein kinase)